MTYLSVCVPRLDRLRGHLRSIVSREHHVRLDARHGACSCRIHTHLDRVGRHRRVVIDVAA